DRRAAISVDLLLAALRCFGSSRARRCARALPQREAPAAKRLNRVRSGAQEAHNGCERTRAAQRAGIQHCGASPRSTQLMGVQVARARVCWAAPCGCLGRCEGIVVTLLLDSFLESFG